MPGMLGDSMKKLLLLAMLGAALLIGAFYALNTYRNDQKQGYAAQDYKDAEYVIDGQHVRLHEGVAEERGPEGTATTVTTRYFGNDLRTDLDGDGRDDVVFFLTRDPGGSGTFYYVAGALNTERGYVGTDAVLIGDRIAPQSIDLSQHPQHERVVAVNYADRAAGEPMTARPSVGKTLLLKLDPQTRQFGVVANDFEGEANPASMSLTMKTWVWQSALYQDGREIAPTQRGTFTITFKNDGTFDAATDCNSMGGRYVVGEMQQIGFIDISQTLMACENSQEKEFSELLQNTSAYHFSAKGELILELKFDSGSVVLN